MCVCVYVCVCVSECMRACVCVLPPAYECVYELCVSLSGGEMQ